MSPTISAPISFFKDVTSLHEAWVIDCSLVLQHRVVSAINKLSDQKIYLKNEWSVSFLWKGLEIIVVCYVTPYSPIDVAEELVSAFFILRMETGGSCESLILIYQIKGRHLGGGGGTIKILTIPVHIFNLSIFINLLYRLEI